MINDPIVEEIHRIRERMWDDCGGDLEHLIASFRSSEAEHPGRVVSGETFRQMRREAEQPAASGHIE